MLKKILQVSSLAFVVAMGASISANAKDVSSSGIEEELSVPPGSYTSDMPAPDKFNTAAFERKLRHDRFVMRFAESGRHMRPASER